jgi:hypothetical protein
VLVRSRRNVRLVVASALGVGALALAACSAGQIAPTAQMSPAVPGVNASISAGPTLITLRDLTVVYNNSAGYQKGGTAPLSVRIFNDSPEPVTLTGVNAGELGRVVLTSPAGASPSASPSATSSASPSASPSPSGTATATPTATKSPPVGQETFRIKIEPGRYAALAPGQGPYLQLTDLTQQLRPGQMVPLTFTFEGGLSTQVTVPFGPPATPPTRATADEPVHDPDATEG